MWLWAWWVMLPHFWHYYGLELNLCNPFSSEQVDIRSTHTKYAKECSNSCQIDRKQNQRSVPDQPHRRKVKYLPQYPTTVCFKTSLKRKKILPRTSCYKKELQPPASRINLDRSISMSNSVLRPRRRVQAAVPTESERTRNVNRAHNSNSIIVVSHSTASTEYVQIGWDKEHHPLCNICIHDADWSLGDSTKLNWRRPPGGSEDAHEDPEEWKWNIYLNERFYWRNRRNILAIFRYFATSLAQIKQSRLTFV